MRFGCCSNLLAGGPGGASGTGLEFIERIAAAGFDYIEMPLGVITQMTDDAFAHLLERIAQAGIACETCTNLFPPGMQLTGPAVDAESIDRHVAAAFHRANRLGAEFIVFGSGRPRSVPPGFGRAEAWAQLAGLLRRIAPMAEAEQVTVVIEPLRHQESNILNTFAEACRLAGEVSRSSIQALVDYYHLATEREPVRSILEGAEWLRHVHYAGLSARRFPDRLDDDLNLDFFRALRTIGYDRRISLEAFAGDFDGEAAQALRFLKHQVENAKPLPRLADPASRPCPGGI